MVLPNGSEYKLAYLDTNVLRDITDNAKGCANGFKDIFLTADRKYFPCFSYDKVCEINPYKDVLERFIACFEKIPCFMFYHYKILVKEEYKAYMQNKKFKLNNIVMRAFIPNYGDNYSLRYYIKHTNRTFRATKKRFRYYT